MSMPRARIFTSMFRRRVALLYLLCALAMLGVGGQLVRLTVVEGSERLRQAERPLTSEQWVSTVRGRVLDRKGRVLAEDRPSYDILVDYSMITGVWAYEQAARRARRDHAGAWPKLSLQERDALIEEYTPEFRAQLDGVWSALAELGGMTRSDIEVQRTAIVSRVHRTATTIWERRRLQRINEWTRERETAREVSLSEVARPIREQREPHVILRAVGDEVAFASRRLSAAYPGVHVRDAGARVYPYETMRVDIDRREFPSTLRSDEASVIEVRGVATHMLGWMRDQVQAEDVARRPRVDRATGQIDRGHYQPGDSVGATGVELAHEDTLRGLRGLQRTRRDTGEQEQVDPVHGGDVELTLDIQLQAHVQAILDPEAGLTRVQDWHENTDVDAGAALAGSVVILEVGSGDILAAATWPTFTRADLAENPEPIFTDPVTPAWVDRALGRAYAPASIAKPLTLCEALGSGKSHLGRAIPCTGHFLPNRQDILRCWIYRDRFGMVTHSDMVGGPLGAPEALARSCNIYFYTLGRELGTEGMHAMYRKLGALRALDIGGDTVPGAIGAPGSPGIQLSDAIMMAMGQGPVAWTNLHAASAYAALARGGLWIEPRLDASLEPSGERVVDLKWPRAGVEEAMLGLEQSVRETFGTGHHLTIEGRQEPIFSSRHLRIVGKTGTGQAPPTMREIEVDGRKEFEVVRRGEHAWTVILVGPKGGAFEYAIGVVVEHAGSGGRVSGPIANQAVLALIREGYLPAGAATGRAR